MNFLYFILEAALLLLPVAGLILAKYISARTFIRIAGPVCIILIIQNILYLSGYAVNNTYFNYALFAVEFPLLALAMYRYVQVKKNRFTTIVSITAYALLSTSMVVGLFGSLLFLDVTSFKHLQNPITHGLRLQVNAKNTDLNYSPAVKILSPFN